MITVPVGLASRGILPVTTALLSMLMFSACSEADTDGDRAAASGPQSVVLDPDQATRTGDARHKCWSGGCWWVVWCGHNICDGSWQWSFPASGTYEIVWKGVSYKCAGAPPYELRINGEVVRADRLAQYGTCEQCIPGNMPEEFRDTSLGRYALNEGDDITLYVKNDFACGIDGPGAYAAFDGVAAERRD